MTKTDRNTFPYSEDSIVAPYSDGLISSGPDDMTTYLAPLGSLTRSPEAVHKLSGEFVEGYLGATDMVFADRVWHPQLAGDS